MQRVLSFGRRHWRPSWTALLRRFGLRFVISLVILGVAYGLIFGFSVGSHNKPNTPSAKRARLATALDQIGIDGSIVSNFQQNDATSYSVMEKLFSQEQTAVKQTRQALAAAPVTSAQHQQAQAIIDSANQALTSYSQRYSILQQVIIYDPQADLGKLDFSTSSAQIEIRAAAAQKGIAKAANSTATADSSSAGLNVDTTSGGTLLIPSTTKQALLSASQCFGELASQLQTNQAVVAAQTRANCVKSYTAARGQAIKTVIQGSFSDTVVSLLQSRITNLDKQLNSAQ